MTTHSTTPLESTPPPQEQPPIYFAGGFGYDQQRNAKVLGHIAELGYDTVPALPDPDPKNIDPNFSILANGQVRYITRRSAFGLASAPQVEQSVSSYQRARAYELIKSFEARGGNINAIFQSADALNGLIALHERPDLINNAVFAYPAGIINQPHPFKAAKGVIKSVGVGKQSRHQQYENFEHPEGDKPRRPKTAGGMVTAASVALSYQAPLLSEVREQPDAPGVSMVFGTGDWMIRGEQVFKHIKPTDVDYILVADTPHGLNGRKDIMDKMLELFPMMEQAKQDRQSGIEPPPLVDRLIFTDTVSAADRAKFMQAAQGVDLAAQSTIRK